MVRRKFALSLVLPEAQRRLQAGFTDDTEWYPEELAAPVDGVTPEM